MKSIIAALLLFTGLTYQQNDLIKAIDQSDFVGLVTHVIDNHNPNGQVVQVKEVFKGNVRFLKGKNAYPEMTGGVYLLLAKLEGEVITNIMYPVERLESLSPETKSILQNLPCSREVVIPENPTSFCTREYLPVCGCDGKTYSNHCEMRKAGIIKFRPAECK